MPGPTVEVGKLRLGTEVDLRGIRDAKEHLNREAESQGKAAGERIKGGIITGLKGVGLLVAANLTRFLKGPLAVLGRGVSNIFDAATLGTLALTRSIRSLAQRVAESNSQFRGLAKVMDATAAGVEKVAGLALRVSAALTGAKIAAGAAAAAILIAANRAAADFIPSWNRVRTLLGESPDDWKELRFEVTQTATAFGRETPEAMEAFYEILSAMPDLVREPARALGVLETSLAVAATGFGTAGESAKAITAILNAFNLEAEESRRVADALFAAQDQGVTKFGEIAASIGRVADLVSNLGGEFEDVLGIIATVTPSGVETNEVLTQLRSLLSSIINITPELREEAKTIGLDLSLAAIEAKGLNGFIRDLIETTGGDIDVISRFVGGQEARALLVSLGANLDDLRTKTGNIRDAAGTTASTVDTMNDSLGEQAGRLNRLKPLFLALGATMQESMIQGLEAINRVLDALEKLDERRGVSRTGIGGARVLPGGVAGPTIGEFFGFSREGGRLGISQRIQELVEEADRLILEDLQRALDELRAFGRAIGPPPGPAPPRPRAIEGFTVTVPGELSPPAEPTSPEFSLEKIQRLNDQLEAQALLQFALTGNVEAYEAALQGAQEQVNALVLAEVNRLKEAGIAEDEILKLAGAYRTLGESTGDAGRARERLGDLEAQLREQLRQLTSTATQDLLHALDQLEAEAREAAEDAGVELSEGFIEGLERLRNDAFMQGTLARLRQQFQEAMELDVGPAQARALREVAVEAEAYSGVLERGTRAQRGFNDLQEEAWKQHRRTADAIAEQRAETERLREEEEKRQQQEAERRRQEEIRDLRDRARMIEENARAALQLAEALGLVDDRTADVLQGLVQLGTSIARIAGGDLSAIPSALASAATLASALFGQGEREIVQRASLINAMRDLEGAILSSITSGERDTLAEVGERVSEILRTFEGFGRDSASFENPQTVAALQRIQELTGIQFLDGNTVDIEAFRAAWEAFQELELGVFGEDLLGRIDAWRFVAQQLGDAAGDAAARFQDLLQILDQLGFGDLAAEAREIFGEEGWAGVQAWWEDLVRRFAGNDPTLFAAGGPFAGLTAEEAQALLDSWGQLIQDGLAGGGGDGTTQAFQVTRTITETSAGVLIGTLSTMAVFAEQQRDLQREMLRHLSIMSGAPAAAPTVAQAGLGAAVPSLTVNFNAPIASVSVEGGDPAAVQQIREGAQVAARRATDDIDRRLNSLYKNHLRAQGR